MGVNLPATILETPPVRYVESAEGLAGREPPELGDADLDDEAPAR
jgi:hypothetical protein